MDRATNALGASIEDPENRDKCLICDGPNGFTYRSLNFESWRTSNKSLQRSVLYSDSDPCESRFLQCAKELTPRITRAYAGAGLRNVLYADDGLLANQLGAADTSGPYEGSDKQLLIGPIHVCQPPPYITHAVLVTLHSLIIQHDLLSILGQRKWYVQIRG